MDQELADDVHYAPGRPCMCSNFLHEMTLWHHLERMTSYQKSDSVNRCMFTWKTILPNFKMPEP